MLVDPVIGHDVFLLTCRDTGGPVIENLTDSDALLGEEKHIRFVSSPRGCEDVTRSSFLPGYDLPGGAVA